MKNGITFRFNGFSARC